MYCPDLSVLKMHFKLFAYVLSGINTVSGEATVKWHFTLLKRSFLQKEIICSQGVRWGRMISF